MFEKYKENYGKGYTLLNSTCSCGARAHNFIEFEQELTTTLVRYLVIESDETYNVKSREVTLTRFFLSSHGALRGKYCRI